MTQTVQIRIGDIEYTFEVTEDLLRTSPESAINYIVAKARVIAEIATEQL